MSILKNVPNLLTLFRIGIIPIFILLFYLPFSWSRSFAAAIFALACFTDWLDGYLARKLELISHFGTFLDPVADKLLVASSLLMLVGAKNLNYLTLPAIIIVGREIMISALREWMAEIGRRASVTVSYIGKLKTTLQMIALFLLIAFDPSTSALGKTGFIALYLASFLTIWSMIIYIHIAWPELIGKK